MNTPSETDPDRPIGAPRKRPRDRAAQILRAASDPIVKRGFHDVTMEEIADAAGVTARALYRHYSNKQSLLAAVIAEGQDLYTPSNGAPFDEVLPQLVDDAIATRNLTVLWQREARYLEDADRLLVRARIGTIVGGIEASLAAQLPAESGALLRLRAWAVASVLTSLGLHGHPVSTGPSRAVIEGACRAVALAPLMQHGTTVAPTADEAQLPADLPRREALLAGGAQLFARYGYCEVSTGQIGKLAGIAGSGIYRHFASKQDILDGLIIRCEEWEALEHVRVTRTYADPKDLLTGWVAGLTRLAFDDPTLLAVRLTDVEHASPTIRESARRSRADRDGSWSAAVTSAAGGDVGRAQSEVLVAAARAVVVDLARTPRLGQIPHLVANAERLALAVVGR